MGRSDGEYLWAWMVDVESSLEPLTIGAGNERMALVADSESIARAMGEFALASMQAYKNTEEFKKKKAHLRRYKLDAVLERLVPDASDD